MHEYTKCSRVVLLKMVNLMLDKTHLDKNDKDKLLIQNI